MKKTGSCKGNYMAPMFNDEGIIVKFELFLTHHKNTRRWKGTPVGPLFFDPSNTRAEWWKALVLWSTSGIKLLARSSTNEHFFVSPKTGNVYSDREMGSVMPRIIKEECVRRGTERVHITWTRLRHIFVTGQRETKKLGAHEKGLAMIMGNSEREWNRCAYT